MVCHGPEPPHDSIEDVTPPPDSELVMPVESDEDDDGDYSGYQPLPQGLDGYIQVDHEEDSENENTDGATTVEARPDVPPIEPVDVEITRQVWSTPRANDPIQMDIERAQQVMSAMANFALPISSIPEWAQSVSEDQWKQQLQDKIETLRAKQ